MPRSVDVEGHSPKSGLTWIKSSLSFANGNCVEVASLGGAGVRVRDSRNTQEPDASVLEFSPTEWRRFVGRVKGNK